MGSKLHVVCDQKGVVLGGRVTAGQRIECTEFVPLMEGIAIRRAEGPPRRRPRIVAGDKGYSTPAIRTWCRAHPMRALIPERTDQRATARTGRGGSRGSIALSIGPATSSSGSWDG